MFDSDISVIPGVGDVRKKQLLKLGIQTVGDMLYFFPRRFEDRIQIKTVSELLDGDMTAIRVFACGKMAVRRIRPGFTVYSMRFADETGSINALWYNNKYIEKTIRENEEYCLYGKINSSYGKREIITPVIEKAGENKNVGRIVPVYNLTADLSGKTVASIMEKCLACTQGNLPETLPLYIREKYSLCEIGYAMQNIHFPKNFEKHAQARRRFVFEEFFLLQTGLRMIKEKNSESDAYILHGDVDEFSALLPFRLTGAQKRVIDDIYSDISISAPMSRLLQGDVGSGKTVVAASLLYAAAKSGCQGVLMAPTEILAKQHFEKLSRIFSKFNVVLLTGSLSAKAKKDVLTQIQTGKADIIIGTHALLEDPVTFKNLVAVICDEQHRFGVKQRVALSQKGKSPHVLVMSATPIPRTLTMILYGDLDVSVIDELPPGRQKIETFYVGEALRERVYHFIKGETDKGRQAYIVCPLAEESDKSELKSVMEFAGSLTEKYFKPEDVLFIHGKLKEKAKIMETFAKGEAKILVSTTVIEVGVDVQSATIMVIENAERFGLSQLHQLRGRVGRGGEKSYCIMFSEGKSEVTRERMKIMVKTNDGFKIAEKDLELRGPGDFFGTRQHGLPELRIANIFSDTDSLREAGQAADILLSADPSLSLPQHLPLKEKILSMFAKID